MTNTTDEPQIIKAGTIVAWYSPIPDKVINTSSSLDSEIQAIQQQMVLDLKDKISLELVAIYDVNKCLDGAAIFSLQTDPHRRMISGTIRITCLHQ